MADKAYTFHDLEVISAAMLSEKSWPNMAPTDRNLRQIAKIAGFNERYGGSLKTREDCKKLGPSPAIQEILNGGILRIHLGGNDYDR